MNTKQNMTKSDNERQISSEEIKKRAKEIIEAAKQNNEDGIDLDAYTLGDINEPEATMHSEADIPDELKEFNLIERVSLVMHFPEIGVVIFRFIKRIYG